MQEPDCVVNGRDADRAADATRAAIEVFVGVDIAKGDHYACAVSAAGTEVLSRAVPCGCRKLGRGR